VRWMLTAARTSPRHYRDGSLAGQVVALSRLTGALQFMRPESTKSPEIGR